MVHELLAEGTVCTVRPNGGVSAGDTRALGEVIEGDLIQINLANDLLVGSGDLLNRVLDAGTEISRSRLGRDRRMLEVRLPRSEGAGLHRLVPVVVDYGVAKDAEEPGVCGLAGFECIGVRDRPKIRHLQDVFGGVAVPNSALDEGEEPAPLFHQVGHGRRHIH